MFAQTPPAAREAQMQLFIVIYSPGAAWRAGTPMAQQGLGPHAAYMAQLQRDGRLYAGGGFGSDDGGMAILSVESLETARALIAADPAVTSEIFAADVRQWRPRFRSAEALPE